MNPDKVSQSTRNKVEQAALEVGYLPQSMGRNVKRNESRTILVIVPDICDPFFSEVIRGIEVTAAEHAGQAQQIRRHHPPRHGERGGLHLRGLGAEHLRIVGGSPCPAGAAVEKLDARSL